MRNLRLSFLLSIFCVALAFRAFAQEPSPSSSPTSTPTDTASTSRVTVFAPSLTDLPSLESSTATRLPAPILDTDRSVQVIPQQLIEDRAIVDPQEAVQNVSGVERGGSRTGGTETYFIRGFEQGSLVKDGFRAGELSGGDVFTFEASTDMANIDRIEVLKGPSAILYGRGEPGGTVNYITRLPTFDNSFSLEQQFGSYDFYRTELHANWNLEPNHLALRLDASYQNTESFIDFVNGERFFLAPSLLWQIDSTTTVTFRGEYEKDERSTTLAVPYDNGHVISDVPYNRYFGEPDFTNFASESWRGLLTLEHRWNEDNQTTLSVHGRRDDTAGGNFILYPFAGPLQDPVTGDIQRDAEDIDYQGDYFTARLDHVWNWTIYDGSTSAAPSSKDGKATVIENGGGFPTVKSQLLFSVDFDRQTIDGRRTLSGQSPLNPVNPIYTGYAPQPLVPGFPVTFLELSNSSADATSLLLLDRLSFGETVFLSFGGRYEWFDADSATSYPEGTVPFPNSSRNLDQGTFNPSAGILVKPARNLSVYFNYAESTNSFQNIGLTTANGDALAPEGSRQFELGTKAEFLDGKLLATIALFHINKTDVAASDPSNPFFSINGGDQRSRGVEIDVSGEPIPGWRLIAHYAYIDARVTHDPSLMNNTTGNRLPAVPENSGGFFTTYEFQSGTLKGLGFGGGVTLSDRTEIDRQNDGTLPGWAQTDAVIYYKRGRVRVQLNAKNIFDNEFYYAGSFGFEAQRAPARTLIGSIKYEF